MKLCDDMSKLDTAAKIQKVMKTGRKLDIGTLKKPDGSYTETTEESLKVLLDTHFPDETKPEHEEPLDFTGNVNNLDIDKVINLEAVRASVKSFKPYKSPGKDNIYPALLQQGLDIIENDILALYRKCLREGKSPGIWLETRVAFIPKPGKKDYTNANNTRPISLSSYFTKGLERILCWHLNETLLNEKLDKDIFSYRESVGCEDAIHSLIKRIEKALENDQVCVVLFLDMSAAFNTASINGMVNCLEKFGAEKEILTWTEHMLKNRTVIAQINEDTATKIVNRGCPQGGLKSTILWNGLKQELKDRLPRGGPTWLSAYADDSFNISVGKYIRECVKKLQKDIPILEGWADDFGLKFNPTKTKAMLFTKQRNPIKPDLTMYGENIEWVTEHTYLGVKISENLNWKSHIKHIAQKATYTMMNCRKMMSRTWGLNPRISRWMYTSLVRPIMTYASFIWIKSTEVKLHMKIVRKVQRRGCLSILNAMHTTPTAGMEIMLDILPIQIHLKMMAIGI